MAADDLFLAADAVFRLTSDISRAYDHARLGYFPDHGEEERRYLREVRFIADESDWYLDLLRDVSSHAREWLPGVAGPIGSAAQVLRLAGELANEALKRYVEAPDVADLRAVAQECEGHFEIARNRMRRASADAEQALDAVET